MGIFNWFKPKMEWEKLLTVRDYMLEAEKQHIIARTAPYDTLIEINKDHFLYKQITSFYPGEKMDVVFITDDARMIVYGKYHNFGRTEWWITQTRYFYNNPLKSKHTI